MTRAREVGEAEGELLFDWRRGRGRLWYMYLLLVAAYAVWLPVGGQASTGDELDPDRAWLVAAVTVAGNTTVPTDTILAELQTKARPWYMPWKERPHFDPLTLKADLERLHHFYVTQGYYHARVTYELQADAADSLVTIHLRVRPGSPVRVAAVDDAVVRGEQAGLPAEVPLLVPLEPGAVFAEAPYVKGAERLRDFYLDRGHAWAEVQREAEVDLNTDLATVRYTVDPGPEATFGETRLEGEVNVAAHVILREVTYEPGETFSLEKIRQTRKNLMALDLFRSVQVTPAETDDKPDVVPMLVRVEEKEPRNIRIMVGYKTEEEFIGEVAWRHRNWLGGGRRLSFAVKASSIFRSIGGTFIQPRFPTFQSRSAVEFKQQQEDEETYLLNATRLGPRLEHTFSPTVSAMLGFRFEYLKFNDVNASVINDLSGLRRDGTLFGPALRLVWDTTEDPLNPQSGGVLSVAADQAGEIWNGDYRFYKFSIEAKKYISMRWQTVLAMRLKLGFADTFGSTTNIPLSERFYAGGENSVRGYGRRRLGRLSRSDDPLGGLTLIEGTLELRRQLWRALGGAIFLDFGQLSLDPYDVPLDDLKFAPGFGVSYDTPVGPLRLDIGFPLDPPRKDAVWKVHFSVGQSF